MRPERAVVKKALIDCDGNKVKASALLGCTRQSLYTWIYQYGLERLAGVRMDTRTQLDTGQCQDRKEMKSAVYSAPEESPTLRLVDQTAQADLPVQATFKVRESLWRRMKIAAIQRGCTIARLAEISFERTLTEEEQTKKVTRRKEGRE